jgi:predicted enzyme related to lactoylglutathione lyase
MSRRPQAYRGGHLVVVIDCSDLDRSAQFWTSLLGYARDGLPCGPYQSLVPADGQGIEILLQQVPETKREKTRLHLDLRTTGLAAEVERAIALGATLLTSQPIAEAGWQWHILADPDGNEFCILHPPPGYWRTQRTGT